MRLAEVQTDDIIDAGQQLESGGSPVNGWTLRRALGDKGRPNHLIEVWQSHQPVAPPTPTPADAAPGTLPPELAEQADRGRSELAAHYDGLMLAIFSHADAHLKERYKAEFERLLAERDAIQDELDAASASVTATEAALGKALASVERMRDALTMAQTEIVRSETRIQAAEAEARHLREQAARLASSTEAARREAAELSAAAATAKAEVAAERRRADRAERDGAAAEKAAAAASLASTALKGEIHPLQTTVAQLTSALDDATSRALAQQKRAEKAERDLAHTLDEQRKQEETTGIIYIT